MAAHGKALLRGAEWFQWVSSATIGAAFRRESAPTPDVKLESVHVHVHGKQAR